jgi:hypothetical protein
MDSKYINNLLQIHGVKDKKELIKYGAIIGLDFIQNKFGSFEEVGGIKNLTSNLKNKKKNNSNRIINFLIHHFLNFYNFIIL